MRKQHVSMRGKVIDMELLRKKNELTPAVGNARVNARGDELGPGGKIVRKREDIVKEYYEENLNVVKPETRPELDVKKQPAKQPVKNINKPRTTKKTSEPTVKELEQFEDFDKDWEEDAEGNFVKKGSK